MCLPLTAILPWSISPLILVMASILPSVFANDTTDFTASSQLEYKYFHEAGTDDVLGHYDRRFFHGIIPNLHRKELLSDMMRAYLCFFDKIVMDTWIAHGTLLGWWWNGQVRMC